MNGSYDPGLVALSYVVAVIASFTALELARRVATSRGRGAVAWLLGGAVSMGIGIWTMHFVGMLALEMNMPLAYDVSTTVGSLVVGVVAAAFAIFSASRKRNSLRRLALAGTVLGFGIAAMHYTGMAAMRMPADIVYDTTVVAMSVVIAVIAAFAALWIAFTLASTTSTHAAKLRLGAALVMGFAICGMHYTGMYAASYELHPGALPGNAAGEDWLALCLAAAALFILGATHLTIFFDYKLDKQQTLLELRNAELLAQTEDLRRSKAEIEHEMEQRKRAQDEAVYLSTLLDESQNEILVLDVEAFRFTHMSKSACDNLGYSKEQMLRMTPDDIQPEESRATVAKLLEPIRQGHQSHLTFEAVHKRADSSTYPVEVSVQLLHVHGKAVLVAVARDVSERKRLETQLQQAQRLESMGQLAAGIAHEINTPTQFVGDNTRFLKDAFDALFSTKEIHDELIEAARSGSVGPELVAQVEAARANVDLDYLVEEIPSAIAQSLDGLGRIAHIVRAMKEFSHPGSDTKKPIDLHATIENVMTVSSNEWKYVADIETDFDDSVPTVPAYGQDLSQSLLNIIVNAAHAIEARNGDGAAKGAITIATRMLGDHVEVRLGDTGAGMPDEVRKRVFDPFFTTKEVGKGTGQGLSIAYASVVDKHGGNITVESEAGVGTTFIITLPLTDEATEPTADAAA